MKKITVLPQKFARLCDILSTIATPVHITGALEQETDIVPLAVCSAEKTWNRAETKFLISEMFSPMERAEFRKLIELTSSEKELGEVVRLFACLNGNVEDELTLLIRKAAEVM